MIIDNMDKNEITIGKLAALNPCVKFVIDNYAVLCAAHDGKTILVLEAPEPAVRCLKCPPAYVAHVFDSMVEAMSYTRALKMEALPYALKECNGGGVEDGLTYSVACRTHD